MAPGVNSLSPLVLLFVGVVFPKPWYTTLNAKVSSFEGFSQGLVSNLVPTLASFASSVKTYRAERDKPPSIPKGWEESLDDFIKMKDLYSGKGDKEGDEDKVAGKLTGKESTGDEDEDPFGFKGKKRHLAVPWWTSDLAIFLFLFLLLGLVSATGALLLVRTRAQRQTRDDGPKVVMMKKKGSRKKQRRS